MTTAEHISAALYSGNACNHIVQIGALLKAKTDVVIYDNRESLMVTDINGKSFIVTAVDSRLSPHRPMCTNTLTHFDADLLPINTALIGHVTVSDSTRPQWTSLNRVGGYRDALSHQMLRWKSR